VKHGLSRTQDRALRPEARRWVRSTEAPRAHLVALDVLDAGLSSSTIEDPVTVAKLERELLSFEDMASASGDRTAYPS
jgi:hypothetical protein